MKSFMKILYKMNLINISYADSIEDTPVNLNSIPDSSGSSISSILVFFLIFILITCIFLFLFVVLTKKNKLETQSNQSMKIIDKIRIDHNSSLYAVKIQNEVHILGKTDNCISPISVITDKDKVQQIELDAIKNQEQSFQAVFNEQLSSLASTSMHFKNSSNTTNAFKFNGKK